MPRSGVAMAPPKTPGDDRPGPDKMETSLPTGSSEVVDKPIIIMVEAKMVGTQTDLVLAEKKSSLEKETQDVKVAKYFF